MDLRTELDLDMLDLADRGSAAVFLTCSPGYSQLKTNGRDMIKQLAIRLHDHTATYDSNASIHMGR